MGLEMEVAAVPAPAAAREHGVEIYLLSRYYFGAKDAAGAPRGVWGPADYLLLGLAAWADFTPAALPPTGSAPASMASSWWSCPNTPLVLLLQVLNSSFVLPGGRLRTGEEDVQGLKRKLSSKLSIVDDGQADAEDEDDWQVWECIGMWWRSEFEVSPFPYMPHASKLPRAKGIKCRLIKLFFKLFLIRLPMPRQFVVPRNMKLLAVPLSQIHNNAQVYGPVIAGIPNLLSKFSLNVTSD
ncbi:hypothetical protein SETIT_6G137400v2 [Setaria italica]|uniref:Pre-mRNA cleavage factor Im 25 kDa subunit n=1 Tax=Setaria italica TaxID=4555 RepID=A0A368RL71_SETIT|nr:hypothetical protein SETIT_6G137400v2 [Setaria italica]